MATYLIDESDTRFSPDPENNATIIPRAELVRRGILELRRTTPRSDVPSGATEFIGNNRGPDGADVDIYGVRLQEGDVLSINVNDVGADTVNHLVRIFGEGANANERARSTEDSFEFTAPRTGKFFIAVSARGNGRYDPDTIEYGNGETDRRIPPNNSNPTGAFELELQLNAPPSPSISISDAIADEGDTLIFTMSLSEASTVPITVDVNTVAGSAIASQDYSSIADTITFGPGETSKTVLLTTNDDSLVEGDETVEVRLQNPTGGATIGDGIGIGTIKDNDSAVVSIMASPTASPEGDSDTTPTSFTISLSNPVDIPIIVDYSTADGSATVANNDYQPSSGSVTFESNEQSKTIVTNIVGDTTVELDENFSINLGPIQTGGRAVTVGNSSATKTILNDDIPLPKVRLNVTEPFVENGGTATVTAILDRAAVSDVTVDVGFGGEAILGADYIASAQSITIPAGQLGSTITLTGLDDNIVELDQESILVDIIAVTGAMPDGGSVQTAIIDSVDDIATLTISDVTRPEGNAGDTPFVFAITTDKISSRDTIVTLDTRPLATIPGVDYAGTFPQEVIIPAGQSSVNVTVPVVGDRVAELDEQFELVMTSAALQDIAGRVVIGDGVGTGTIINDDLPNVSIGVDQTVIPENGGQAIISASLDSPANQEVIVELELGGEAIATEDYAVTPPTLITIPVGQTIGSNTVDIVAIDDFIDEMNDEVINIGMTRVTNANAIGDQTLSVVITDDDTAGITLVESEANTAVTEGGKNDTYDLVLSSQPTSNVTISISPDEQLTLAPATITFTPDNWNQPQTINVTAVDDRVLEGDHRGLITHTVSSADPKYDGISIPNVNVDIEDIYNVMFVGQGGAGKETPVDKRLIDQLSNTKLGDSDAVKLKIVDDDAVRGLDSGVINQQDLVIISESVASKKVKDTFSDIRGGVMTWESHLYDDLGMTGVNGSNSNPMHPGQGVNYGFEMDASQIEITNPAHPLAAELSGTVDVYNSKARISWGWVNETATVVATLPGNSDNATIFAYDAGAMMANGMEFAGARLGFFLHNRGEQPNTLTSEAISLFNAAVDHMVS